MKTVIKNIENKDKNISVSVIRPESDSMKAQSAEALVLTLVREAKEKNNKALVLTKSVLMLTRAWPSITFIHNDEKAKTTLQNIPLSPTQFDEIIVAYDDFTHLTVKSLIHSSVKLTIVVSCDMHNDIAYREVCRLIDRAVFYDAEVSNNSQRMHGTAIEETTARAIARKIIMKDKKASLDGHFLTRAANIIYGSLLNIPRALDIEVDYFDFEKITLLLKNASYEDLNFYQWVGFGCGTESYSSTPVLSSDNAQLNGHDELIRFRDTLLNDLMVNVSNNQVEEWLADIANYTNLDCYNDIQSLKYLHTQGQKVEAIKTHSDYQYLTDILSDIDKEEEKVRA
ncbi:hypothetical protein N9Y67_04140 [Pseudomonadota bacterium]|nr:hypothetical protein [Pseudomonadota bacterium]